MRKAILPVIIFSLFFTLTGVPHAQGPIVGKKGSVVHKGSGGISMGFPDECKTPTPSGPVPVPYPHIGKSSDTSKGSKKVKMDGKEVMIKNKSRYRKSTGDEAGTSGAKIRRKVHRKTTLKEPWPIYQKDTEKAR